ncbi:MAG: envelope stress response membrane protein PspC [Gammaproteobacteria bacterium]|nr:envelope stress response membrane protein PspC [Gammaproteobacteria bacterium]NND59267.1 envelope stress response membrane protein PspC [Gammaproteobacteria bacterium]
MSRQTQAEYEPNPRKLYRDTERGRLMGVCAGIADYTGISTCAVRWMMFIAGLVWFPLVEIVYVILGFALPRKPTNLYKDQTEEKFWRSMRKSPSETFSDVRYRYRQIDQRMQRLERYVTSKRFNLDREFRDLENQADRAG